VKRLLSFLLIGFLILLAARTAFSQEYTDFRHPLFTIQVPASWHNIPKQRLNALIAEEAKRQGLSGKGKPQLPVFECGFQEIPLSDGLSPPMITVKIDENRRLARIILKHLNTMTQDQIAFTYSEALQKLGQELAGIPGMKAEDIVLDRTKKLLRFTVRLNNVVTLTSIYTHKDRVYYIICNTFDDPDSGKDLRVFRKVSDSFTLN